MTASTDTEPTAKTPAAKPGRRLRIVAGFTPAAPVGVLELVIPGKPRESYFVTAYAEPGVVRWVKLSDGAEYAVAPDAGSETGRKCSCPARVTCKHVRATLALEAAGRL